jgi:hypothetical protein
MVYTGTNTKMYMIYNMEETKIAHCNKTKIATCISCIVYNQQQLFIFMTSVSHKLKKEQIFSLVIRYFVTIFINHVNDKTRTVDTIYFLVYMYIT